MRKNRGFTYIELLVVVAILAIAAVLLLGSFSVTYSSSAKGCAKSIVSALSECKLDAMSRTGNSYLLVYQTDEGMVLDYYRSGAPLPAETVVKKVLGVSWTDSNGTVHSAPTETMPLCFTFSRSAGSFLTLDESAAAAGMTVRYGTGLYCRNIQISGGGQTYTVTLVPATGRFGLELS